MLTHSMCTYNNCISLNIHIVYCQRKYSNFCFSYNTFTHISIKDAHNLRQLFRMCSELWVCAHNFQTYLLTYISIWLHVCAALCDFVEITTTTARCVFNINICIAVCVSVLNAKAHTHTHRRENTDNCQGRNKQKSWRKVPPVMVDGPPETLHGCCPLTRTLNYNRHFGVGECLLWTRLN